MYSDVSAQCIYPMAGLTVLSRYLPVQSASTDVQTNASLRREVRDVAIHLRSRVPPLTATH